MGRVKSYKNLAKSQLSTKTVCCLLSLYFKRKGLSKGAKIIYRDAAASDPGVDLRSPNMMNIGLEMKKEIIDSYSPFHVWS